MQRPSALRVIELTAVAAVFALCGAYSARLFPSPNDWPRPLLPVPFAVLCAVLFARHPKALLSVFLSIPVFYVAFFSANSIAFLTGGGFALLFDWLAAFPMCIGGFLGGLGLALSFGIVRREMLTPKRLFGVAGVAALAAVPFGTWLSVHVQHLNSSEDPGQASRLMYSFATWQAVVGTYLYSLCAKPKAAPVPPGVNRSHA